ncbi:MAG: TlpA family protein disulfide reductase [Bacteroidaceae bacterium]|nr:TlpA family protein disulfide reductase [Bacteroidaceae bacterium]
MKPTKLFLFLAVAVLLGANTSNAQSLTDTYWRNPKTGDWVIGFTEKHVIYDNVVWDIMEQTERKGGYTFSISNGSETKDIKVSPTKKEERTITIDKKVSVKCSPITTSTLPDYPTRDDRQGFKDNGYRMGDSVTIVGWLKDMPAEAWERGEEFEVAIMNILTDEQDSFYAPLDSLGRFAFKVPLFNTSQAFLDWKRSRICTVLEPNETYFLLVDFTTGQKLFMGTDARLQNETTAHPYTWIEERMPFRQATHEEAMLFLEKSNEERAALNQELTQRLKEHPNLSQRYAEYVKTSYMACQGDYLMEAAFNMPDLTLPEEYMNYVTPNTWDKLHQHPYTLSRDFSGFIYNYMTFVKRSVGESSIQAFVIIERLVEKGTITLSDKEADAIKRYEIEKDSIVTLIQSLPDEEKQAVANDFNNSELVKTINTLLSRVKDDVATEIACSESLRTLASVKHTPALHNIYLARLLYALIDDLRKPLSPAVMEWMENEIQLPAAKALVMGLNDKYLALQRRDFSSASLKSSDDVEGMSDGEKILRKLIEPYKGKFILLDVWGTWCGPCKAALAKSQKEYEHLKDYDIVYLYLANRSSEESWKNVIKEYNVTGDNVVHYNLPTEQQTAIERFLGVNSYPTYRLIDRNGNILDVNADPRDLNALENLLKTMNGTKN